MISYRTTGVLVAALLLAGCGRHESRSGANSAESHAPGTTLATKAGPCVSYAQGTPGVVNTYCSGPATAKVFVSGKEHDLAGGTCNMDNGVLTMKLGVVSTADLGGPKPDYFGLTTASGVGHFTNATINLTVGGKSYAITSNSGDASFTGGTFTGAAAADNSVPVTGSFTC